MSIESLLFFIFAFILIISAVFVVTSRDVVHSVLFLALVLFTTALLYILLNAEILAAVQVLLYTGGVVTMVIFVIMLTKELTGRKLEHTNRNIIAGMISAFLLFLGLVYALFSSSISLNYKKFSGDINISLGTAIFREYVLPFEVLSVLLVAAIIGAIIIGRRGN